MGERGADGANFGEGVVRFFDSAIAALWIADEEGRLLHVNAEWERVLGHRAEDVRGHRLLDLVHPDDVLDAAEAIGDLARRSDVRNLVHRFRCADGSYRSLQWRATVRDGLAFASGCDVTEEVRAQSALRESEDLLRQIIDLVPQYIFAKDESSRYLLVNQRVADIFGTTVSEVIGKSDRDLSATEDEASQFHENDLEVIRSGRPKVIPDERLTDAQGRVHRLEAIKIPFRYGPARVPAILGVATDVTEIRDAQDRLARSEAQYRQLAETTQDIILLYDLSGGIAYANPALCRLSGYSEEEIRSLDIMQAILPEYRDLEREQIARRIAGDIGPHRYEIVVATKDGRKVVLEIDSTAIVEEGRVTQVLAVARDITDYKAAAEKLAESQAFFAAAIEQSPSGILVVDAPGIRVRYANSEALALHAEMGGWLTALSEDERPSAWKAFRGDGSGPYAPEDMPLSRAVLRGEVVRNEEMLLRQEGEDERWLSTSAGPIRNPKGEIVAGIVVFHDITAQRKTEAALLESERRFREMLENVRLAAVMLDRDGRIAFANDELAELTGWSKEDLVGRDWVDTVVPKAERSRTREEISSLQGTFEPHVERSIVTRQGNSREVAWDTTFLRGPDGTVIGLASLGRDVTEIRRLEEQVRQSQKMEAIGQLAGGVAHDFNNLLQVITGYVRLAMADVPAVGQARSELEQVADAASRATALVRQLLTFSRRETVRRKSLDLGRVIADTAKMLRRVIGETIRLETAGDPSLPRVYADPGHIEQILFNLCVNARDAMPEGGTLRIETSSARRDPWLAERLPGAREEEYVLLVVSDTGAGMPPEVLDHVFEPFFTTKEVGKGTGLGLATVYGIVRQHDGLIRVESEVGRGTTIRIYFPVARGPEIPIEEAPAAVSSTAGRGETILVAEDEDEVRDLVAEILRGAGYRVLTARDGEEAVEIFDRAWREIDLVVMDAIMPRRTGRAAYDAMKATDPTTRVLFCSGYSFDSLEAESFPEGSPDVLAKPFTPDALLEKVRQVLDRRP